MQKRQVNLLILVILILIVGQTVSAQEFPAPIGYVNDFAQVLDQRSRAQIQVVAEQLKEEQGIELGIPFILPMIPPSIVPSYSKHGELEGLKTAGFSFFYL